jgi:flavin reductase
MSAPALKDAPPAPVSAAAFKEAMSRVVGAVHIVTTDGPAGRAGFTATSVCSVTADPPTLLVCVNESSSVGQVFIANSTLAINTVGAAHNDLAMLFGGKTPLDERFAAATWTEGEGGAPILEGAIAAFRLRRQPVAYRGHAPGSVLRSDRDPRGRGRGPAQHLPRARLPKPCAGLICHRLVRKRISTRIRSCEPRVSRLSTIPLRRRMALRTRWPGS